MYPVTYFPESYFSSAYFAPASLEQSTLPPTLSMIRDAEVLQAIAAKIKEMEEFAQVSLEIVSDRCSPMSGLYPQAIVSPVEWVQRYDEILLMKVRDVTFRIAISVRCLQAIDRVVELDQLVSKLYQMLDRWDFAVGCLPERCGLTTCRIDTKVIAPEARAILTGQISYPVLVDDATAA